MLLLFSKLLLNPLFETPGASGGNNLPKSEDDIVSFLDDDGDEDKETIDLSKPVSDKDDSKDIKDKESKEDKDEDENEDDEDKDEEDDLTALEDELEPVDDEKLELTTPVSRREILKAYPDLFKKFPYLEKAYYREQQFTELLPTIEDAKKAVQDRDILQNVSDDLNKGDILNILKAVKGENPEAFNKLADSYLETLAKIDEKAYHHVVGNTAKHIILQMVKEAKSSGNEALQTAAQILNQYLFGSSEWKPPSKLSSDKPEAAKDDSVAKEREALRNERFVEARDGLNTRVNNAIRATIEQNIDPKESMSPFIKKAAVRDALESVTKHIQTDKRLEALIDKLWENASKNNFSKDSLDKIRSAFTSRAKTLLPTVIKLARNEALKGIGKRVRDDSNESDSRDGDGKKSRESKSSNDRRSARPEVNKRTNGSSEKKVPSGMSALDYLMSDD